MLDLLRERKAALEARGKKGFTLMEMLIVIAIIAILIAIAIPIFTQQMEKSREATDEANIRSLYSEVVAAVLSEDTSASTTINGATLSVTKNDATGVYTGTATIELTQQENGLVGRTDPIDIGGRSIAASDFGPGKTATITVDSTGAAPTITIA